MMSQNASDEELLYDALNAGDTAKIEELLARGVEINAYVRCGRTLLGRAVQLGHVECIQMILNAHKYWHPQGDDRLVEQRRKCDVNLLDYYERTPLHYAAELGKTDVLELLLKSGCRVNSADSENITPLHLAAARGYTDVINKLLQAGSQVNRKTSDRASALHIAASRGFSNVVEVLIQHGAKVNVLDTSDRTPLLLAVNRANHDVVQVLIKYGAKVNIEEIHGYTPLAEAVWQKDQSLVRMLLEAGAKVTKSHYLLHYCVMYRSYGLVELLLSYGCLVNLRDDNGDTPLHIAARTGEIKIIDILLRHGANVNFPNSVTGTCPLHEAVEATRDCDHHIFTQALEKLLHYSCDLNHESYLPGDFPFYRAMVLGKFNIATTLIRYGCDVNKGYVLECNNDSLCLARRKNNMHLAKLLVYSGFDMARTSWLEILPSEIGHTYPVTSLKGWLIYIKTNPMNLSDLCRIIIRKKLGQNVREKILQLFLPPRLKRYLLLEDAE